MRISLFLLVSLVFVGCASVNLEMAPELKARATYQNGTPSVIEQRGGVLVCVGVPSNQLSAGEPLVLLVSAGNKNARPFNFGPENITATINGKPLKVFTWEELRGREISKANWQAAAAAMSAASSSLAASQPRTTYGSGNFYGSASSNYRPGNQINYSGNYYGSQTTYDPAAASLAQSAIQNNTDARMAGIAASRDASIGALEGTLRTTTINRGAVYSGLVRIASPSTMGKAQPLALTIKAAGETFTFPLLAK